MTQRIPRRRCLFGVAAVILGSAVALAGCGGSASSDVASAADGPVVPAGMSDSVRASVADSEASPLGVDAPPEANFTLFCRAFTGPNHGLVAQRVKEQVEQASGLSDFYLVTGESRTALYHGFYETFDDSIDAQAAKKAQAERDMIERLVDSNGSRLFTRTVFEPLERPDPTAPPAWDLHNADGYWTLLIATYTEDARRKQAAVESVRAMRESGIEGYFLHKGPQSHVFIGTWPAEAVKRQQGMDDVNPEAGTDMLDPETLIVGMTELDPAFKNLRDHKGRPARVMEVKVEPVDAELRKLLAEYEYSVNGFRPNGGRKPAALVLIHEATNREDPMKAQTVDIPKSDQLEKLLQRPF